VINSQISTITLGSRRQSRERTKAREEFSDRCRKMCQRTIRRVHDEETERVINEEAERRLLAPYIHGLMGVVGQQVQFQMPSTMEQAVRLDVTIESVEKHKQLTDGSRKIFAARRDAECYRCAKTGHFAKDSRQDPRRAAPGRLTWSDQGGSRRDGPSRGPLIPQGGRGKEGCGGQHLRGSSWPWGSAGDARRVGVQCFHCHGFGH
jgi:hypothetical protein